MTLICLEINILYIVNLFSFYLITSIFLKGNGTTLHLKGGDCLKDHVEMHLDLLSLQCRTQRLHVSQRKHLET